MKVIIKVPLLEEQISEKEIMLYDENSKNVHLLNSSAAEFYHLCDTGSLEDAISSYVERFSGLGIGQEKLREDAGKIYTMLCEKGVIRGEDI